MAMRINHNIHALNAHRNLTVNDMRMGGSLEKLSSGLKINRASDSPAGLIISEQLRAQVASVKAAIGNTETGIAMMQTSESALTEVNNILTSMRGLAVNAANEGANDKNMVEADQLEFSKSLETIDRLTFQAQFGTKKLLDGSTGANGVGTGAGVQFLDASPLTRASPVEGYDVRVFKTGTRGQLNGKVALTRELIDGGELVSISEGGRTLNFQATKGDTVEQFFGKLKTEVDAMGMDLKMIRNADDTISIVHNKYGTDYGFEASSKTPGFISDKSLQMDRVLGEDIEGTLGGQFAQGKGQVLMGGSGSRVDGLRVLYTGDKVTPKGAGADAETAGRVAVYQNSLNFQIGPNPGQNAAVSLINTNTRVLARGVVNDSGFKNLHEANLLTAKDSMSSLVMVDEALNEVNRVRAQMGAFQKNSLEANLRQLRVNFTELTNSESVIRDADMAEEMVEFTRNNIMEQASTAMLAQANQLPNQVLALLK
jgi:flagellin